MFHQTHDLFIEFDSPNWKFVQDTLMDLNSVDISVIPKLQAHLWGFVNYKILNSPDTNKSEFESYLQWAVPQILSLPSEFPEGLSKYFTEPIIRLSKKKCLIILLSLFFCCSERVHTFLDIREKAKYNCFLTYLKQMKLKSDEELNSEFLTIERKRLHPYSPINFWLKNESPLKKLFSDKQKKIEDFDDSFLKVDFANQFIGGGVLNYGCVQEEILFSIYPEMLVSMIFCPVMKEDEAIIINGARRVAEYSGYAWGFKFEGEYLRDQDPSKNTFVAIDALMFPSLNFQFSEEGVLREANKAYVGFLKNCADKEEELPPVVTGKWGCGEFGGFSQLKTMIMWIAASVAGRDMHMSTFGDRNLEMLDEVARLYEGQPVGELVKLIVFNENRELLERLIEIKVNPGSNRFMPVAKKKIKLSMPKNKKIN